MFFNGNRLREARYFRQFSISKLAKTANVSKQMISKYEHNESQPSGKTFKNLVTSLKFPLSFFQQKDNFTYDNFGTFYRSRLTSTQSEKKPSEFLKKYLAVLVNFFEDYVNFPYLEDLELSENPDIAASQLRKAWNLNNKPISNMLNLLELKGFHLASIKSTSQKVDAFGSQIKVSGCKYYCILIDQDNNSFYRQQFSLAHELGHWALHSKIIDPQDLDPQEYRDMENQANAFAASFLLPSKTFSEDIRQHACDLNKYIDLKRKWNVSIASMILRAKYLNIISSKDFIVLQKRMNGRRWKKCEPFDDLHTVPKPMGMKQAFELLVKANIIGDESLETMFEQQYNLSLPPEIIAELVGISVKDVTKSKKEKIVKLKILNDK